MESCILCGNELSASQPSLATSCLHKFHLNCIVPYFINNNNCPALGCDSVAAKEIEIGWDCFFRYKSRVIFIRKRLDELSRMRLKSARLDKI
uniref:RING-type domain-containing protein n=1 Tax=Meloidogyne incognita TaxID=6306 RepID=A0A914NL34_MELIC